MSYHEEDQVLRKNYIKQGRSLKATGILLIVVQVALAVGMLIWLKSSIGLLIGFALFTVAKWFVERNLAREYLVTEYMNGKFYDQHTTHGSILGGLLRLAGVFVLFVILDAFVADYVFPEDSFFTNTAYTIGLLWVAAISILRDVYKIKTGNAIIAAATESDLRFIMQKVESIGDEAEAQEETRKVTLSVLAVALVVVLLLVQLVVCWIQAPGIAKKLDMLDAYESYYQRYDGVKFGETLPVLTEEWFEQATQEKDSVKYSRFKTKCAVKGDGVTMWNDIPYRVSMEFEFYYNELNGWRLRDVSNIEMGVALSDERFPTNISGRWYAVGPDKSENYYNNNELTIVLEKITEAEVIGSITCVREGETFYSRPISGTMERSGEYMYIVAPFEGKGKYTQLRFAYDPIQDVIFDLNISPDTTLTRVVE